MKKQIVLYRAFLAQMEDNLLYVLYRSGHQGLFPYILEPAQTAVAKPVEFFTVREASLYGLLA